jgi:predicted nucleic acid-binding protein
LFSSVPLTAVVGHRQVTDAYLVALARHRGAKILSLDKGLKALHPDVVELLETPDAEPANA